MDTTDTIMNIKQIYKTSTPAFSLEFFPPKQNMEIVFETLEELIEFGPKFVSVTSKSDGTNKDQTFDITSRIKNDYGIEGVPHLTCINSSRSEIYKNIIEIADMGIRNVLALRGDIPEGNIKSNFKHGYELVTQIKTIRPDFCIGVAGYPEKHPEAESLESDIVYLKKKVDSGADFVITQMFFDNTYFSDFTDRIQKLNITVPVVPGIMPVFSFKNINRFAKMCGVAIPQKLKTEMENFKDDPESISKLGIDHAVEQCSELLDNGVPGLHFYTMNRTIQVREILKQLQS